ncbi:sensor histidine kinase [Psychroserpens ponticola]|uniref:histidine kinase n=1 Tax=Psychroserpens ponticola TaxID=2932268 RepID=A0ABY7RYI5_9FLAO|nr:HAMP domain-containing sensor histidine kinase [Psychroserpens ponticola]WCO02122.1 HAMP domain-containing sensor histidine kinase [Psychroserpens ponticola]
MNDKRYQYILYLIVFVIISTIAIQVFWNYKNYQTNKQQVYNDIQWSLDNAVETYYTTLSKKNFLTVINSTDTNDKTDFSHVAWDTILKPFKTKIKTIKEQNTGHDSIFKITTIDISGNDQSDLDSIDNMYINDMFDSYEDYFNKETASGDTLKTEKFTQLSKDNKRGLTFDKNAKSITANKVFWGKKSRDSLKLIKGLSTIYIAMQQDSLDYKKLDSLLISELKNKGVSNDFYVTHLKNKDTLHSSKINNQAEFPIKKNAKTTYLKADEIITLNFKNPVSETFKRSFLGISLSTLLILAVISCLFYLLRIIKHQKQLSEVKNDLISNITHEFKTPIATIGVALESIQSFNVIDDKEKTKNYLDMSSTQLSKLNTMVEKLLETATLDSENLELNTERYNISEVITAVIEKHKIQNDKLVHCDIDDNVFINVDIFHFENAINNIIDNAFKYGGNQIEIQLKSKSSQIEISVSDNGTSLTKANKDRVFEKFYRVPKGNTHDIKGFGIGLYYTKKIIEKHNGTIQIQLEKQKTTFKIVLAYA